jgi:S-formylglutathione hydrolase
LKNPGVYKSVSAFAPISNPINCPWGKKAFGGYLSDAEECWQDYDATELISKTKIQDWKILIDQGSEDQFLKDKQLLPENFIQAAKKNGICVDYKLRDGYDHSYFFISTFIGDHFEFHSKYLKSE